VWFVFFTLIFPATAICGQEPEALEILSRVAAAYRSLDAYQDKGTVKTEVQTIAFETKYRKPNLFAFHWTEQLATTPPLTSSYAIWSDGVNAYECYRYNQPGGKGIQMGEDLRSVVAGATGISLGTAHRVPSFFNGVDSGYDPIAMRDPVLDGGETIGDTPCWRVRGKGRTDLDTIVALGNGLLEKERSGMKISALKLVAAGIKPPKPSSTD